MENKWLFVFFAMLHNIVESGLMDKKYDAIYNIVVQLGNNIIKKEALS